MSWTEDEAYQPHQDAAREIGRATSAAVKGVVAARLMKSGKLSLGDKDKQRSREREIDRGNEAGNRPGGREERGPGLSR